MSVVLETERLIFKIPLLTDVDDAYALQSDVAVMQYVGQGVRTYAEVQNAIEKTIIHQAKHGFSLGGIYLKATGACIGRGGLIYLAFDDTQPDIEVAYSLHPVFWGKGYATEFAKAVVAWGFANLAVDTIVGVIHPKNQRSRHVLEKVGLQYVKKTIYGTSEVELYAIKKTPPYQPVPHHPHIQ